ncbi:MAG: regulatory protein RecX [Termitinemataceae bacterium]
MDKILAVKKGTDADLYKIQVSGGSFFYVRISYLEDPWKSSIQHKIGSFLEEPSMSDDAEKSKLSEDEYIQITQASLCYRIERRALALIARSEQNRSRLYKKLLLGDVPPDLINKVLDRLESMSFINDRRFIEAWIRSHISKGNLGAKKAAARLVYAGIPYRDAQEALHQLYPPENEALAIQRFVDKKMLQDKLSLRQSRYELTCILQKAGFSRQGIRFFFDNGNNTH